MAKKKKSFEEALRRLEDIVEQLEEGEIALENSIKYFEEGKELVQLCLKTLDNAEKKVKKLEVDEKGNTQLSLL